jgi:hypothetical protein
MLARYHARVVGSILCFCLAFVSAEAFEIELGDVEVSIPIGGAGVGAGGGAEKKENEWELEVSGDEDLMTCTLQDNNALDGLIGKKIDQLIQKGKDSVNKTLATNGICSAVNYSNSGVDIFKLFSSSWGGNGFIRDFIGKENVGNPFDLGGFAKCKVDFDWMKNSTLGKLCSGEKDDTPLSPPLVLAANSVEGEGLFAGGMDRSKSTIPVEKREYPSGLTGKDLYSRYKGKEGGYLIASAEEDPYGSTAVAMKTFDKASIVLKTMALKSRRGSSGKGKRKVGASNDFGADNADLIKLPPTKAKSLDLEDETVQYYTKLDPDLNEFKDTLTRRLRKIYTTNSSKGIKIGEGKKMISLAKYRDREKNATAKFYKDKKSGLASMYEAAETEAKAELASELLLMTADPNYIADPSEARLQYIKDSQRNAFKYAALIQQEKNKQLKLRIARKMKHKKQMIDMVKRQAEISASLFRDDIARHEIKKLLKAVDESVKYE